MSVNAGPSDVIGHPMMAVSCCHSEGSSPGKMLAGEQRDEAIVQCVARAFEGVESYPPGPKVPLALVGMSW